MAELALLVGFAWLGASALRAWLLPRFEGAPAFLASAVLALAVLLWAAELLGSFGAWEPVPYLLLVGVIGLGLWKFAPRSSQEGHPHPYLPGGVGIPLLGRDGRGWRDSLPTLAALLVAAIALVRFALETRPHLSTGMTGFDSTWYHGPFAAGFFQSGDTWSLHFIAPQFLAWFYPANSEVFHAAGMQAFGRDLLSPLLNLGWFVGCLVACWCIGRPYRVAPWSLGLGAIALSVPALADQAGEARNDIVGIFFLLAAVAIALNAWAARGEGERGLATGSLAVIGLAAGLAAGTKLNFLLPAGVLVLGLAAIAPRGARLGALGAAGLAALAGGGYWYLRNLAHSGNPLPWIHHLGPIDLPAPEQALGGREAHSVLGYLGDGAVWSDWLLPGLHDGLWFVWPLLGLAALAGLVLALDPRGWRSRGSFWKQGVQKEPRVGEVDLMLPLVGLVGLATALAWLVAPTSASGPEGMPRGFESGLRYLAPALVLGLALLPAAPILRSRLAALGNGGTAGRGWVIGAVATLLLAAVAVGYPVQRNYLENRYADPSFTTPGLNATFAWSRDVEDARIATTSTRQYPLFGTDLSNHVEFIGEEQPHGGFEALATCRAWREALNEGDYDYVVASRDRLEKGKPTYPAQARWTEGPAAKPILKVPPTVVFQLNGKLDPSACR
ncbi:MAG TPA: hypothetical protein VFX85_02210 [Solirubrobacterales bacterium]|nr:hypothetical protein [Solirubrobacterales bacterium]